MGKVSRGKDLSEDYRIFARKFRPETFEEVVGQEQTTQILRNAVKSGRIPQSFLFAGPRGTGKTSTARILAKALNCEKGPTEKPCNQCVICQEITRSFSLDVLEIDGASNRRIDEVRDLRENVKFKPAQARFKIYIIDEVHMLTDEAFNALLKTLEEPPEHVKFIFATTEPHKVPLTILSRCQRFHFKRIPTEAIAAKLKEIAHEESLKPEPNALFLIARASEGSLRDAETLLDQLGALSGGKIREEDVLFALGLAGDLVYFELLEALQKKEAKEILSLVGSLYDSGKDLVQFGRGLHELFRNLLLLNLSEETQPLIEASDETKRKLLEFKNLYSREELLLITSLLQNLQADLRRAIAPPRLLLEVALLKILHAEGLHSVEELVEGAARSGGGETPRPPPPAGRAGTGQAGNDDREIASPQPPSPPSLSLTEVERIWPQVLEAVKAKEMSSGMFLAESEPVEANERGIVLGFPEEFQFHKEMLERPEKRKLIEEIFSQRLGTPVTIEFVTTKASEAREGSSQGTEKPVSKLPEIVTKAMTIFEGSKIIRPE